MSSEAVPAQRWREPTRSLPLTWGRYEDRYLWGLILIIAGAVGLQASSAWSGAFLLQGVVAHAVGWSILPSRGWRRMLVLVPASGQIWFLLTGPLSVWTLLVPYLAWLLVRHRPARSYITAVFPLAAGFILPNFFVTYAEMLPALVVAFSVMVASAWLARLLAMTASPANPLQSSRKTR